MESLLHADIFFFITAVAVIVLTVAFGVALLYLIRILKDFKEVSRKVKNETELISEDIANLRAKTYQEGARLKSLTDFASGIFRRTKKNFRKKSKR